MVEQLQNGASNIDSRRLYPREGRAGEAQTGNMDIDGVTDKNGTVGNTCSELHNLVVT